MKTIALGALMRRAWPRPKRSGEQDRATSYEDARSIMGTRIHALEDISLIYRLDKNFFVDHGHIRRVPFSRRVLEWAAENEVVATPRIFSAHRMARLFPDDISIAEEVYRACSREVQEVPRRVNWHLVMRPSHEQGEDLALKERPRSLPLPIEPSALSVFLAMAYADFRINGIPLMPGISARYTRAVIQTRDGIHLRRVIVNGVAVASGNPSIRVVTGHAHGPFRPALAWKPHEIAA